MAIFIIQVYIRGQFFLVLYLGASVMCPYIHYLMSNSNTKHSFSCCHFIVYCWPCLESYVKLYNWYAIHFLILPVHNGTIIMRKKIGIISIDFVVLSLLDPKVNNFDSTHGCPLRNQHDILDNPIPCRCTQYGVLIIGMIQNMLHNTNLSTPIIWSYLI